MRTAAKTAAAMMGLIVACGTALGEETAPWPSGKLPFTISKETTGILGPLRPDGTVDYVAALNEKYAKGVTPANNAFVAWLKVVGTGERVLPPKTKGEILRMCGAEESAGMWESFGDYLSRTKGLEGKALDEKEKGLEEAGGELWKAEDRPEVAAYLAEREKALALAAEAAGRERWWMPYVGKRMIGVSLVSLGPVREVGNAWCARATLRAGHGNWEGCLADIRATRRLARHLEGTGTLIERLCGMAMDAIASRTVGAIAGSGKFSVEQCRSMEKMMDAFGPPPAMVEEVDVGERWTMLDNVRVLMQWEEKPADTEGLFGSVLKPVSGLDREAVDWDAVLKRVNGEMDKEVAAMRERGLQPVIAKLEAEQRLIGRPDDHPEGLAKKVGETRKAYSERVAVVIMRMFMPELAGVVKIDARTKMQTEMARTVVMLGEFRAQRGNWPKELKALVPEYLKEVPEDVYAGGKAVRYVVTNMGVRVYSVGQNGVDDGGVRDGAKRKDDVVVGVQ